MDPSRTEGASADPGDAVGAARGRPSAGEPAHEGVGGARPSAYRRERDRSLASDGWVRRFVGSPPRLSEIVELYEATGREVLLDALSPGELSEGCEGCGLALSLFRAVYTRPAARPHAPGDAPGQDIERRFP